MDRCTFREVFVSDPPGLPCRYPATYEAKDVGPDGVRVVRLCDLHFALTVAAFRLKGRKVILEEAE